MNERLKELDGLRGIAIILVIALHTFGRANNFTQHPILLFITSLTSIGWVGVDIFFVLSGFLITSILLRTKEEKNYFKNFYVRRILRIFPLYYLGIAVILLFIPVLDPDFAPEIPRALPYLLLYQQNWMELISDVNFTQHLKVTWSLAVEEQFYLIWPAIVYFIRKETLLKISAGVILFSLLTRIPAVLLSNDINLVTKFFFYNTITRFEGLIMGGMLAIAFTWTNWKEQIRKIAMPVFLPAILTFIILFIGPFPQGSQPDYNYMALTMGRFTIAALFATALVAILVTYPETTMFRGFFRNKILTFFGKYSYSMYLFHVPVAIVLLEVLWHTQLRGWKMYSAYVVLTFGATVLISLLTWRLLEKHMLNLKKYFEYS